MGIGVLRLVHKTYSALGGVIERFGGRFSSALNEPSLWSSEAVRAA
jgi:hypothetical protein